MSSYAQFKAAKRAPPAPSAPVLFTVKSEALRRARAEHGLRVWPLFAPSRDPKKAYVMNYEVRTLEEFMRRYWAMRPADRVYCEMLPDDAGLKLYMDVEFPLPSAHTADDVVARIADAVRELAGMPGLAPFQVDASKATKASRHLIWPVLMTSKERAKSFVTHVQHALRDAGAPELGGSVCGVDATVYDKERAMRLCYAHKVGDPTRKLWPYPDKDMDREEAMRHSMIAFYTDGLPVLDWQGPPANEVRKARKAPRAAPLRASKKPMLLEPPRAVVAAEVDADLEAAVRAKMVQWYPTSHLDTVKMLDDTTLSLAVRPGVHCPSAGRVHKSNCTWLHVDVRTKVGQFVCADPACEVGGRKTRWGTLPF